MARYSRSRRFRRRSYGFRRRFRRFRTRWRVRTRYVFRNRFRSFRRRYRRRPSSGASRRYSFGQWIWKLGVIALLICGGFYAWNKWIKGKLIKV